jgi:hypothetical protein
MKDIYIFAEDLIPNFDNVFVKFLSLETSYGLILHKHYINAWQQLKNFTGDFLWHNPAQALYQYMATIKKLYG